MQSITPIFDSVTITNTSEDCDRFCQFMQSKLVKHHFGSSDIFAIRLALKEALQNAVEHGNQLAPDTYIRIDYHLDKGKVAFTVTDQGTGFSPDTIPDKRTERTLCTPSRRGILLMKAYMDNIEYNEKGNTVQMVRHSRRSGPTDHTLPAPHNAASKRAGLQPQTIRLFK